MSTILDVDLNHEFWGHLDAARSAAYKEAANTGGAVITIEAAEIQAHAVCFIGTIPESAIDRKAESLGRRTLLGSFHTTWGAVLNPANQIGFLVVHQPVMFEPCSTESGDLCRVAVALERTFNTIPATILGPACCKKCRLPISAERLLARPGARLCTNCQATSERNPNGN
jgi:hypothetical protein